MRRALRSWTLVALVAVGLPVLTGCLTPSDRPANLQAIARWQDQRLAPPDSLRTMLNSPDAHVRLAAVRAAGLIGRDDVVAQVRAAVHDPSQTVGAAAAWALGLIGAPVALPELDRLASDPRPRLREAAVAALGQIQNDGSALMVAAAHPDAATAALAWNGLRNQVARADSSALREALVAGLGRPETDVRWRVLRCAELVPDSTLVPLIAPFVRSAAAQEVVSAYRALARQPGRTALTAALAGLPHLEDFHHREQARVRIAACRALGALGDAAGPAAENDAVAAELISDAGHEDPHVSETALAAMARLVADQPLPAEAATQKSLLPVWRIRLARAAESRLTSSHVGVRAAAMTAFGAVRGQGAGNSLEQALQDEVAPQVLAAGLTALVEGAPHPAAILADYCGPHLPGRPSGQTDTANYAMVRAVALTALNTLRLTRPAAALPPVDGDRIEGLLLTAALDPDFVVSTTAAGLLGTVPGDESVLALTSLWRRAAGPGRFEIQRGVLAGLSGLFAAVSTDSTDSTATWTGAPEVRADARQVLRNSFDSPDIRVRREGRQAALDTRLLRSELIPTDGSLLATLPAVRRDPRQPPVAVAGPAPSIRCLTERGAFTISLDGELAPNTCALFLSLIDRGYFEGLSFHRVVPDFVVQGGDPLGNGWGGPGFTIRSEWSRARFARGVVGIAHDGKDTGGSQFFVTLSPQPHLNGRYTVFGRVASGMDVVDHLEVGDTFDLELAP